MVFTIYFYAFFIQECRELNCRLSTECHNHTIRLFSLDDIPNIGPARRKALRQHYASPEEIREASLEELKEIPELNAKAAESVYNFFHKDLINRRETDEASETEERTARADS